MPPQCIHCVFTVLKLPFHTKHNSFESLKKPQKATGSFIKRTLWLFVFIVGSLCLHPLSAPGGCGTTYSCIVSAADSLVMMHMWSSSTLLHLSTTKWNLNLISVSHSLWIICTWSLNTFLCLINWWLNWIYLMIFKNSTLQYYIHENPHGWETQ